MIKILLPLSLVLVLNSLAFADKTIMLDCKYEEKYDVETKKSLKHSGGFSLTGTLFGENAFTNIEISDNYQDCKVGIAGDVKLQVGCFAGAGGIMTTYEIDRINGIFKKTFLANDEYDNLKSFWIISGKCVNASMLF